MIEIQPVAIEAAIRHQQAIGSAGHLLSCADYLLQALPEAVEDLPVIGDLSVLLTKVGEEIQAARVRFQPVEITPQQDAEEEEAAARVAPWRNQAQTEAPQNDPIRAVAAKIQQRRLEELAAKQEAGKQALSELRSALMQQTIMIRRLADNAGIEDIDTEHEATKLAKEIYFAMDRAWDCVNRATA